MKIILSRKGFDASYGRVPSPILPDGTLLPLPIPDPSGTSRTRYSDLRIGDHSLGDVVQDLCPRRLPRSSRAHLDPDLRDSQLSRLPGWRPTFGQVNAAQRHLGRQGVGLGDLFLFFGWFRRAEPQGERIAYVRGARDMHVLFGWLQVGEVLRADRRADPLPFWARYHPHAQGYLGEHNTLYVAREDLHFGGEAVGVPGGGVFPVFRPDLCLTAPDQALRSRWLLPRWFLPSEGRPPLTYHGNPTRWVPEGEGVLLNTVGRGQEFVLDAGYYPEAMNWARRLVLAGTSENSAVCGHGWG